MHKLVLHAVFERERNAVLAPGAGQTRYKIPTGIGDETQEGSAA